MSFRMQATPPMSAVYAHHPRVAANAVAEPVSNITLVEPEVIKPVVVVKPMVVVVNPSVVPPVIKIIPEVPVEQKSVAPFAFAVHAPTPSPSSVINYPPPLPPIIVPIHDVMSSLAPVQSMMGSKSREPSPCPQPEEVIMRIKRRTGPGTVRP